MTAAKSFPVNKVYFLLPKNYKSSADYISENEENIINNNSDLSIYDFGSFTYNEKNFISIRFSFQQKRLTKKQFYNFADNLKNVEKAFYKYNDPNDEDEDEIKITYTKTV